MIDVLTDEQKTELVLGIRDKDAEYDDWTEDTARTLAQMQSINRSPLDCDQVPAGLLCTTWCKQTRKDADGCTGREISDPGWFEIFVYPVSRWPGESRCKDSRYTRAQG